MKKVLFLIPIALLLIAAAPLQEGMPDLTDLQSVLVWLATVGSPYFVGWALSLLVENWAGWAKLPTFVKFFVPLLVSVLIAVGANVALGYPTIIEQVAPWFTIVLSAAIGWLGTQKGYITVKTNEYGARYQ